MRHSFGELVRRRRELLFEQDPQYSLRRVASRVGVEPSYLSKVERGIERPPGERAIAALARELGIDRDVLLAASGKVSSRLQQAIIKRPRLFSDLLQVLEHAPDDAILRITREVRDGNW